MRAKARGEWQRDSKTCARVYTDATSYVALFTAASVRANIVGANSVDGIATVATASTQTLITVRAKGPVPLVSSVTGACVGSDGVSALGLSRAGVSTALFVALVAVNTSPIEELETFGTGAGVLAI